MANYYINAQVKVDSSTVQAQLNKIKTSPIKLNVDTGNTNKTLKQIVDANGNVLNTFKKVNTELQTSTNQYKKVGNQIKDTGNQVSNTSKKVKSFGSDFISTMSKVTKFFLITKIIQTFTQAISETFSSVFCLFSSILLFTEDITPINKDPPATSKPIIGIVA